MTTSTTTKISEALAEETEQMLEGKTVRIRIAVGFKWGKTDIHTIILQNSTHNIQTFRRNIDRGSTNHLSINSYTQPTHTHPDLINVLFELYFV